MGPHVQENYRDAPLYITETELPAKREKENCMSNNFVDTSLYVTCKLQQHFNVCISMIIMSTNPTANPSNQQGANTV